MKHIYKVLLIIFIAVNILLPKLQAQTAVAPSGSGTQADPYLIANFNNLYWLSVTDSVWGGSFADSTSSYYFKQTSDIDASASYNLNSGGGISPIGISDSNPFNGTYDGNGHTISNLRVYRYAGISGLFGETKGVIENLGIKNADVILMQITSKIGALTGMLVSGGSIINCYTTGRIIGSSAATDVGGLVGDNYGTIQNSYSSVNITSSNVGNVGGLVGISGGSISNCYSTGNIIVSSTDSSYVGGLAGTSTATISNCYSTGNVSISGNANNVGGGFIGLNQEGGTVDNCFSSGWVNSSGTAGGFIGAESGASVNNSYWDSNTSGRSSSAGGTGETNSNMMTQSTFSGWDFSTTWTITQGTNFSYPYLQNLKPLPVEITTFTAYNLGDKVELNWQTATEVNNYGFEVERAIPPLPLQGGETATWQKIGFVKGSGNSNSPKHYSFVDQLNANGNSNINGSDYEYRLKQIDINGKFAYSKTLNIKYVPVQYKLLQNYPNPFNPSTTIEYELPKQSKVVLKIYDILGKELATLVDREQQAGKYSIQLSAERYHLASGVYFYRLTAGSISQVKKLMLLK